MKNKTQRRIHKYFFSHYFCFEFFRKNNIRGNAATNNTPNQGEKKNHRGKVKEVERCEYKSRQTGNLKRHKQHTPVEKTERFECEV
jgi:hypothetical protein